MRRTASPSGPLPDGRFGEWWARDPGVPLPLPWLVRFRRIYLRTTAEPHLVPAHDHDDLEVILVRSGRWQGAINGQALSIPTGGVLVVAPGDRHEDRCREAVALIGLSFELLPGPSQGRSASPLRVGAPLAARRLPMAPALHAAGERLAQATVDGGAWATHLQDAIAQEMVVRLLALLPTTAIAEVAAQRVAATEFGRSLAACFARQPSGQPIATIARALEVSERTLQQRCRALLGASPGELQRRHRLALAWAQLVAGSRVIDVAEGLGFANPFHFSTVFRRRYGFPPSHLLRNQEGRPS